MTLRVISYAESLGLWKSTPWFGQLRTMYFSSKCTKFIALSKLHMPLKDIWITFLKNHIMKPQRKKLHNTMLMKYSINTMHSRFFVKTSVFYAILPVKEMKYQCWVQEPLWQKRVVAFLALQFAYYLAFYLNVFINHDNSMIVNPLDAISESGCNLRLDE